MEQNTSGTASEREQRSGRLPYLPGLDGLRAIAVIAVLLFHAGLDLRGGFLGVESFFVLSGFLITALLLAEWRADGQVNLVAFWVRRARRLLPALFLVLGTTLLYAIVFLPREVAEVRADALAALLYVMNWHLVWSSRPYFDPTVRPPLLQHLWSLAVEEQFYLLWPLLFVVGIHLLRARGLLLATLAAAAGSMALMAVLHQPGSDPSRVYYGTDTRAAGLLFGAALALVWAPGQLPAETRRGVGRLLDIGGALGLAGLIAVYLWVHEQQPLLYPGGFVLVGICSTLIIMAVTHPQSRLVPGVLGWAPLRWIGLRSYGIYLWHWPVFQVTRSYLDLPIQGWPLLAVRFAIVAVLAALSYRWVEIPVRNGALGQAWRVARAQGSIAAMLPSVRRLGRGGLPIPLAGLVLLAGVVWLGRTGTHPSASGSARFVPATARTTAAAPPDPAATSSPVTTAIAATAGGHTDISTTPELEPTALTRTVPETDSSGGAPAVPEMPTGTASSPSQAPVADPVPLDPALMAELQRLLDETVSDGFVPGAVLSVSMPGYLPWNGASGIADGRRDMPMDPGTLMRLGSITKMFTAVVVLQLAEEGKIDLDETIGSYLPDIVPLADRTTIRHLLSHRSGVFDYLEDSRFFIEAYRNPERTYTPEELVGMVAQFGAAFEPGTEGAWKYSSTNYVILGMLVEQVTGRALAEEMRQRIFDPLGLTHTFFAPDEVPAGDLAQGYIDASDRSDVSMTFVFGTGNIISTADDLRRFVDALFGGRLLNADTLAMMTAVVDTGGAYEMPELEYGLGMMRARLEVGQGPEGDPRPDEISTVVGHIGGIAGFRSAAWWVPESGITIALSLNQADIDPNILARDALDVILTWQGR